MTEDHGGGACGVAGVGRGAVSEMIERVALAIANRRAGGHSAPPPPHFVELLKTLGLWDKTMNDARAAIEAMREPTEAMLEARWRGQGQGAAQGSIWKAMIDAALKDTPDA